MVECLGSEFSVKRFKNVVTDLDARCNRLSLTATTDRIQEDDESNFDGGNGRKG